MAWSTPPTFTLADTPTINELNIWSDDLLFLHQPPSCRVVKTSAQLIANNTLTNLTFQAEDWDNDSMHSTSSNTDRVVATTAGRYLILGNILWDQTNAGSRGIDLENNAGTVIGYKREPTIPANIGAPIQALTLRTLSATNYVVSRALQTAGGNLNVLGTSETSLTALWVGA